QRKIHIARFELCALRQQLAGQLRFQRVQTIHVVGKKNEELELAADVREAYRCKSVALPITEILVFFPHHPHIDGRLSVNVEWLRPRCSVEEWICPWRFQINCVRQDKARCL